MMNQRDKQGNPTYTAESLLGDGEPVKRYASVGEAMRYASEVVVEGE